MPTPMDINLILGLPDFMVYEAILVFALFVVGLLFYVTVFMWMRPVVPYLYAKFQKHGLLVMVDKTDRIRLLPATYSTSIWDVKNSKLSFIQRIPKAYRFGETTAVLVHDGWGIATNPSLNEGLMELQQMGISNYDQLEEAINEKQIDMAKPIITQAYHEIGMHDILNYVMDVNASEIRAHIDERIAKIMEERLGLSKEGTNMKWIIIGGIMLVLVLAYTKSMKMW
jgi:hypothetical protein